jgi:HEAT repeat protein
MTGRDAAVLADLINALGRCGIPAVGCEIAPLAGHPDAEVRVAVAQALGELGDVGPEAVASLVVLSRDTVDEVRSWATFALADDRLGPALGVADALAARLHDPCGEVRVEAVRGLARRGDPSAVDAALDLAPAWSESPVFRQAVDGLRLT